MTINSIWAKVLYEGREKYNYRGRLLTLGRQNIEIKGESVKKIYRSLFQKSNGAVQPEDYFRFLGFKETRAMDLSTKDGADILHDLNDSIPASLENQFDFIIDGGTMEHCFDIKTVMTNIFLMLKEGGTVIHLNSTQGDCNHGFYNFQPTFYYSFYRANHYRDLECFFVEFLNQERTRMRIINAPNYNNLDYSSPNDCLVFFKAVKGKSAPLQVPVQEFYYHIYREKEKVNGAMIEDALYQKIVGNVTENKYDKLIKDSYIVEL